MHRRLKMVLAGVVLSTSVVSAQQARPATSRTSPRAAKAAAESAVQDIQSLINGVAVNNDQTPLANVTVRLRNLKVNRIEQTVTANGLGEFTFATRPDVPYVVEIVDQSGRTVAVGDVILARTGEVAGTKVTLRSGLPALAGTYGGAASTVVAAAVGTGVQVVDPALPKVSPTR